MCFHKLFLLRFFLKRVKLRLFLEMLCPFVSKGWPLGIEASKYLDRKRRQNWFLLLGSMQMLDPAGDVVLTHCIAFTL
jgi:hypothetical protein